MTTFNKSLIHILCRHNWGGSYMWEKITIAFLVLIFTITAIVAAKGGIENATLKEVVLGTAPSILATLFCMAAFWKIEKNQINEFVMHIFDGIIKKIDDRNEDKHFYRVARNVEFDETFWLKLIDKLDSTASECWFVGNRLRNWRESPSYSVLLKSKLSQRFKCAIASGITNNNYRTYILLGDESAGTHWQTFIAEIIDEVTSSYNSRQKTKFENICKSSIVVTHLNSEFFKYALTKCDDNLVVVNYVGASLSQDNPTSHIKCNSPVYHLYLQDLENIKVKLGIKVNNCSLLHHDTANS